MAKIDELWRWLYGGGAEASQGAGEAKPLENKPESEGDRVIETALEAFKAISEALRQGSVPKEK